MKSIIIFVIIFFKINVYSQTMYVNYNKLNLRSSPFISDTNIIKELYRGDIVNVENIKNGWAYIRIELWPIADTASSEDSLLLTFGYVLSKALSKNEPPPLLIIPISSEDYTKRGRIRLNAHGDYKGATSDFLTAIRLNPKNDEAFLGLGKCYYKLGKYKEALSAFNKAISLGSQDFDAFLNRGNLRHHLKDYAGAINDYTIIINSNDNPNYFILDDLYESRANAKLAIKDFYGALADFNFLIPLKLEKYEKIVFKYDRLADEYNKEFAELYLGRGVAKAFLHDTYGAISDFTSAIGYNPFLATAYENRGISKCDLEQKESGCIDLSKAGELGDKRAYEMMKIYCK